MRKLDPAAGLQRPPLPIPSSIPSSLHDASGPKNDHSSKKNLISISVHWKRKIDVVCEIYIR